MLQQDQKRKTLFISWTTLILKALCVAHQCRLTEGGLAEKLKDLLLCTKHARFTLLAIPPGYVLLSIVIEGYKILPCHPCHKSAPLTVFTLTWKLKINPVF